MSHLIVAYNPNRILNPDSKAASSSSSPSLQFSSNEDLITRAPPGPVPDRIRQKRVQTPEGPAIVTGYEYEGQGSSSGEQVYQCGAHNFDTKNLNEFNNHINTTHNESKIASVSLPTEPEVPIIEGIPHYTVNKVKVINDFIMSNGKVMGTGMEVSPITNGPAGWKEERHANGSVVYTNPNSKVASVPGINKVKVIHNLLKSNGRL